ncbi:hypothetical protein [Caballeronia sp. Lep1P3]|uniref:hypothetical protein n=1 Tax=Caballeronia sp. Lep1P3 TaxID=2878150 RepID=UPI001FD58739|nr:hypothetical protein [Caballeronia sp. Lep1P3]
MSLLVASFLIGAAMTRFLILDSGMMPDWTASSIRFLLEKVRVGESVGAEDIQDADFLIILLTCWSVALLVMFAASRLTGRVVASASLRLALIVAAFASAYIAAEWLEAVLLPPVQYIEPEGFRVPCHAGLILSCWLGGLGASFAALCLIRRYRAGLCRRITGNPEKK